MPKLDLFAELVPPGGSMAGTGARRVLGRAKHSPLALAIREAIQNSWDARATPTSQVHFTVELVKLERAQVRLLATSVFPGVEPFKLPISRMITAQPYLLLLKDEHTKGLEGPVRADKVLDGQPRRFVDFFRNLGHHERQQGTGGTYGFGKTSLYGLSKVSAIVVATRARPRPSADPVLRFMAAALADERLVGRRRFTGRLWWGEHRALSGDVVDPVEGRKAESLCQDLGIDVPSRGCGTSIGVVVPKVEFGDRFQQEVVETILYNFWPKMLARGDDKPPMRFSFISEGRAIAIPDPDRHPKIAPFVECYRALGRTTRTVTSQEIAVKSEGSTLVAGKLTWTRVPAPELKATTKKKKWEPFGERITHVCLLRTPELVVNYIKGPPMPMGGTGYAGVFRAADEHDDAFAASEPPAHDDWEPRGLPPAQERLVGRTLRSIQDALRAQVVPRGNQAPNEAAVPLGALSQTLGGLLDGITGDGASVPPGGGGGGGKPGGGGAASKVRITYAVPQILERRGSTLELACPFVLKWGPNVTSTSLEADLGIAAGSARELESEPALGDKSTEFVGWKVPGTQTLHSERTLVVKRPQSGAESKLALVVRMPASAVGAVSVSMTHKGGDQ